MSPKIRIYARAVLILASKNAVAAVLTNAGLMAAFHNTFHLHDWIGIKNLMLSTLVAIGANELKVFISKFLPPIIKWTESPTPGIDSEQ